jgi:hypothetical protein
MQQAGFPVIKQRQYRRLAEDARGIHHCRRRSTLPGPR